MRAVVMEVIKIYCGNMYFACVYNYESLQYVVNMLPGLHGMDTSRAIYPHLNVLNRKRTWILKGLV